MFQARAVRCGARESDAVFEKKPTCQTRDQHGGFQVLAASACRNVTDIADGESFCVLLSTCLNPFACLKALSPGHLLLANPHLQYSLLGCMLCLAEQDNFATC